MRRRSRRRKPQARRRRPRSTSSMTFDEHETITRAPRDGAASPRK
ncbi:hypothetical protein C7S16_3262 [Burkholderia thailandensis]|uniref:Uncharacterized protein n=1 Tax=Burkholderia thailandensis TaxID=57975 RepID=A0AAW9CZ31_BURTH|nr:hypothetical protein [Burkholderia thailandensis]MDW9255885.1 hypothetical protein [Burkholderia thailandensis]